MSVIDNFEKMLAAGQDSALLRFSLGSAYYQVGDASGAIPHLASAVAQDNGYSAAWKIYGRALTELGRFDDAMVALETGIAVAEKKGDIQAKKEMTVFLKRAQKKRSENP